MNAGAYTMTLLGPDPRFPGNPVGLAERIAHALGTDRGTASRYLLATPFVLYRGLDPATAQHIDGLLRNAGALVSCVPEQPQVNFQPPPHPSPYSPQPAGMYAPPAAHWPGQAPGSPPGSFGPAYGGPGAQAPGPPAYDPRSAPQMPQQSYGQAPDPRSSNPIMPGQGYGQAPDPRSSNPMMQAALPGGIPGESPHSSQAAYPPVSAPATPAPSSASPAMPAYGGPPVLTGTPAAPPSQPPGSIGLSSGALDPSARAHGYVPNPQVDLQASASASGRTLNTLDMPALSPMQAPLAAAPVAAPPPPRSSEPQRMSSSILTPINPEDIGGSAEDSEPLELATDRVVAGFECPSCACPQDESDVCVQCGLIFAKYKRRTSAPPPMAEAVSKKPSRSGFASLKGLFKSS